MRLFLDDDVASARLLRVLREAGHDVQSSRDVGLLGADDAILFADAIRNARVLVTGNHAHFGNLHDLIACSGGMHPGLLVVRKEDDRRDMSPKDIDRAIAKLVAGQIALESQIFILNHWR